MIAVGIK